MGRHHKDSVKILPRRTAGGKFLTVAGEIFVTVGALFLLYIFWQLVWTNIEADAVQAKTVEEFVQEAPKKISAAGSDYGLPPPAAQPSPDGKIGVIYIPRLGVDYVRPLLEGVSPEVLDTYGIGHYPGTALPGDIGNVAVAGHRQTHGAVFDAIDTLRPGDKIYIQTRGGYFTYVQREQQIVLPTQVGVIEPVPGVPGVRPSQRLLTLTSCHPRFGSQERIASYAVFESWQPAEAGPPAGIAAQVARLQKP